MKRRITFIYDPDSPFDPKQLEVEKRRLKLSSLKAAREEQWTTNIYDLPQELWLALKQIHELHIRWAPTKPQSSIAPFASVVSPGLHILLTPHKDRTATLLCPSIEKVFGAGLNCTLPEDAFTRISIIGERFASSASLQYYEYQSSISNLFKYIQEKICSKQDDHTCTDLAGSLAEADYVDIDYDSISQSLRLSAFWHAPPSGGSWNEEITQPSAQAKVEVGILASQQATRPHDVSLGGYLITLGQNVKPDPTLFSFPSRHHPFSSNYTVDFVAPTGLHPNLRLAFPHSISAAAPSSSCALHAYLTLPSSLFPDKYQLSQPNLLKSNNLASLRALSPPAPDLEAPVWATREWGSALLLELSPPPPLSVPKGVKSTSTTTTAVEEKEWHATIPLHLRYHPPSSSSSNSNPHADNTIPIKIPNPVVFWACPLSGSNDDDEDSPALDTNPFDRTNLGYDGLFGPRTVFYHLRNARSVLSTKNLSANPGAGTDAGVQVLNVPVLDMRLADGGWVGFWTGVGVLVGAGWVMWCLALVAFGGGDKKKDKEDEKERRDKKTE